MPNCIMTRSGALLDFDDPGPISIEDVAVGLSRAPRFGGQSPRWLSVAEHSGIVQILVRLLGGSREARLWALLHDGHEAFVGDLPTPLKSALGFWGRRRLRAICDRLDAVICADVALRPSAADRALVKRADAIALSIERDWAWRGRADWGDPVPAWVERLPHEDRMSLMPFGLPSRDAEQDWLWQVRDLAGREVGMRPFGRGTGEWT